MEEVLRILAFLQEKGSIRRVARATDLEKKYNLQMIQSSWKSLARVIEYYLNELRLDRVQVAEI
jgi:hypothetical protein